MTSEWLKVMLGEIERKRIESEEARLEEARRRRTPGGSTGADTPPAPAAGSLSRPVDG